MATVRTSGNEFTFTSRNLILSYNLRSDVDPQLLKCEKPEKRADQKEDETKDKDKEKQKEEIGDDKELQGNEAGSDKILACGLSPSGRYLVACDDYKQIWIWIKSSQDKDQQWTLHSKRDLGRRSTSLTFPHNEQNVLIADKSGDVFSYSLTDGNHEGQLLMGHVSMLLDLALCGKDDNFLVTCDRDEKVRVSHYPNAYNIQAYCLGHTDFVSRLAYFKEEDLLISGGGDGTIRIWDYRAAKQLFHLDLTQDCDIISSGSSNGNEGDSNQSETTEAGNTESSTTEEAPLMSRTEGVADVKYMKCCQKNKFLAVGFDNLKILLLFKLDTSEPGKPQLVKKQKLEVGGHHVLDISFDQWDNLWYLEANEGNTAHVMSYDQSQDTYKPLEASDEPTEISGKLLSIASDINTSHQEMFKASLDTESSFALLHKVKVDNISGYMERKQQRIEEKEQKRKGRKGQNSENEEKKFKTS